ncbi:MAG TPA: hypothetical protein VMR49_02995 [Candidatus Paceibacterota bacterium]|nr:hypothetical protein [Candidatus Paceibacterota bacterium]
METIVIPKLINFMDDAVEIGRKYTTFWLNIQKLINAIEEKTGLPIREMYCNTKGNNEFEDSNVPQKYIITLNKNSAFIELVFFINGTITLSLYWPPDFTLPTRKFEKITPEEFLNHYVEIKNHLLITN